MDRYGKVIRVGAVAVTCALVLRLGAMGVFDPVTRLLSGPTAAAVVLFLEMGYVLRPGKPAEQTRPTETAPETQATAPPETQPPTETEPEQTETPPQSLAAFAPEDAALVEIHSYCGYHPEVQTWLENPLSWNLTQDAPSVLILHSHGTESYENTENYAQSSPYRTRDENYNVVSVGDALVQHLELAGIRALHDRQTHDYPSYSDAYAQARTSVAAYLEQHPSIRLVLDLHRDAVEDEDGNQLKYTVDTPEGAVAQLMLVVGTDAGGLTHSKWPENMSLAVKLHAQLEKLCPGICRPISFRSQRFNQDLSTGAVLVEVGAAGNTRQEALAAVRYLADAIKALSNGTR